jgi:hypothetical protein
LNPNSLVSIPTQMPQGHFDFNHKVYYKYMNKIKKREVFLGLPSHTKMNTEN